MFRMFAMPRRTDLAGQFGLICPSAGCQRRLRCHVSSRGRVAQSPVMLQGAQNDNGSIVKKSQRPETAKRHLMTPRPSTPLGEDAAAPNGLSESM